MPNSLLKLPTHTNKYTLLAALCFVLCNLTFIKAYSEPKTLLILNSYHEDELWGNRMTEPIINHMAHNPNVICKTLYLNNSVLTDSAAFNTECDNVFETFAERHPDYIVMVGNFAFNMRDRIKQEWGDIPFVLVSRTEGFGSLDDYYATLDDHVSIENRTPLSDVRNDYNFTTLFVPDYCSNTVDLMVDLIPDLETIVFIADVSYVNRVASYRLYNYIMEEYPNINYRWLMASEENSEEFRKLMVNRDPKMAMILSSWAYEIQSTRGYPVLTTKDLTLITSSVNPVFTLRHSYVNYGTVGGVFTDNAVIQEDLIKIVDQMLEGQDMRKLPFLSPKGKSTMINYRVFEKFGYDIKKCPKGTVFIGKPQTYWEKYWVLLSILAVVIIIALSQLIKRNKDQRKKINILNRHKDFVNNMPVPYTNAEITLSADGKLKSYKINTHNQAFEKMLTINSVDQDELGYILPKLFADKAKALIEEGSPQKLTYHFEKTDNYYDIIIFLVKSTKNADGSRTINLDAFCQDITERQKMQMNLRKIASTLYMTLEISKLIPWQLDWKTKKLSITPVDEDEFKRNMPESTPIFLGDYIKRIHPEDMKVMEDALTTVNSGEVTEYQIEYRISRIDDPNTYDWVINYGKVIDATEEGEPITLLGSIQNITETKDREEVMAKALAKANESDRLKSAFLANMSHEIRTPLNAIVGFSSMMVKAKDEQKRFELSQIINKNNDLLLNLINDVLDLAKIESNTIELVNTVCDINDLLSSVGKTMAVRIPKNVKFNIVQYADKCIVEIDTSRLTQVIINLLTNACKFTSKGNITAGYEIQEDEKMLYFFVKDTGIGIPKEKQASVFEQFVKLDNFAQGTGLGLAICRSLVTRMGGEIGLFSEGSGRGCTFWFTVPYNPVEIDVTEEEEVPQESLANSRTEPLNIEDDPEFNADGEKRTVLVAEDNESNYWLLQQILADRYRMVWAKNGKEAVDLFQAHKPDFIIMDINMPKMDGYEATNEIRKISQTVPIIAVTAYAFASDRIRILNSGFNAYVSKPLSEIALFEAIHHVMTGKNEMP